MLRKTITALVLLLAALVSVHAQDRSLSAYAGLMAPYEFADVSDSPAPAGYKPFYISHYGRHGSRYHLGFTLENYIPAEMIEAHKAGALTDEGEAVLEEMLAVLKAHDGRDGDLTPIGDAQHRKIAERMYKRFPKVFRNGSRSVRCRSSHIPRCILSMSAFGNTLQKMDSRLNINYSTGPRDFRLLCRNYDIDRHMHIALDSLDAVRRPEVFDPRPLVRRLFKEGYELKDPQKTACCIYNLGSVENGIGMGNGLFASFTQEELQAQWMLYDERMFGILGNSVEYGDTVRFAAKDLLADFISCADAAVAGKGPVADLRFGHDSGLMPLVVRMGLRGFDEPVPVLGSSEKWIAQDVLPCAANLQMVLYRKRGAPVLVKILYNEQETGIPALTPVQGPYYSWDEVRKHWTGND